jgi:hypothetical protein
MRQNTVYRSPFSIVILVVLVAFFVWLLRYGAALNPFDGCVFPDARTNLHQDCHLVNWIWNE